MTCAAIDNKPPILHEFGIDSPQLSGNQAQNDATNFQSYVHDVTTCVVLL